jgi:ribosomal protein S3AE
MRNNHTNIKAQRFIFSHRQAQQKKQFRARMAEAMQRQIQEGQNHTFVGFLVGDQLIEGLSCKS